MIDLRIGDSRKLIHELPDKSIDCVVTSPPYWGLRDYKTEPIIFDGLPNCEHEWQAPIKISKSGGTNGGISLTQDDSIHIHQESNFCSKCGAWKGQLGLEPTPELFIKHLLDFFDDVRLKLKDEGNCFVNLGDSYSGSQPKKQGDTDKSIIKAHRDAEASFRGTILNFPPAKCMCMIPQRFAWGMIEHGWILRNEIIWAKPNHMPESVTDRLTKSHEVIYHFVKQQKYYYDLDAIREPHSTESIGRYGRSVELGANAVQGKILQRKEQNLGYPRHAPKWFIEGQNPEVFGSPRARTQKKHQIGDGYRQGMNRDESDISIQRVHEVNQKEIAEFLKKHIKDYGAMDAVFGEHKWRHWIRTDESGSSLPSPDDWKYLREVMAPWLPNTFDEIMLTVKYVPQVVAANVNGKNPGDVWNITTQPYPESHFAVFPLELVRRPILAGCPQNGTVLDPFAGSGTVGEFCRHNDRNAILFELNPEYKKLIEDRAMLKIPSLESFATEAHP